MPPKKKDPKAEKGMQKAAEKEKQKIVEDKTFGLKNKNKSKNVQKYIKAVQQQVKGPQKGGEQALIAKKKEEQEAKKREAQHQALLASLFRSTETVKKLANDSSKVGTYDPKASKESQRIDLYTDQREQKSETMEDWDQEQLEHVIRSKHTKENEQNATAIICRHFLEAVEKRQYGWFWSCPGGGDACKYRHCLPPGYVLKRDLPQESAENDEPIEVIVERERAALPSTGGTPVTLETFTEWKALKEKRRRDAVEHQRAAEAKKSGNRGLHVLSGRDLFQYDPSLFVDDEGAAAEADYEEDEEERNAVLKENQKILEEANRSAALRNSERADGQSDGDRCRGEGPAASKREDESAVEKRNDGGAESSTSNVEKNANLHMIREDLFLYGDDPEDEGIDALDD